ncbi:type II toxin-antitoxin system PemK/MazF family toxin, partial [Leucobacter sp. M11]|uniref:type II toxin-antitoxin system PemK/MazF family toxin n=1 Tax=Leucobacter sp. M11 TaxID=2993565 RepID=UPI002D7EA0C4
ASGESAASRASGGQPTLIGGLKTPDQVPSTAKQPRAKPSGQRAQPGTSGQPPQSAQSPARPAPAGGALAEEPSPGQFGPGATRDLTGAEIAHVELSYAPEDDRDPDPGEVVWTWVPYEEHDGRGKDRPVLIVGRVESGVAGCFLTSKSHDRDGDYVSIGSGPWDSKGRESWLNMDRVLLITEDGMRREGHALDPETFARAAQRLQQRFGWQIAKRD